MRALAAVATCVLFIACASKPPLPPPPKPEPATPSGDALIGADPVDPHITDGGSGTNVATTAGDDPRSQADDDDDWQAPVCKMPKPTCKAFAPKSGSITMDRTACYGRCPIYKVTIHTDGTVQWHGEMFVDEQGDKSYSVDKDAVAQLFAELGQACFFSFKGEYTADVTDHPSANLTLKVDGRTKVVKHYLVGGSDDPKRACDATDKLARLEMAIDKTARTRKLVGKGGKSSGR